MALFSCSRGGSSNALPLLSLLVNNRMIVILKGTYASDSPLNFSEINGNALYVDGDDTVPIDTSGVPSYDRLKMYIDIGEIRLSSKNFQDNLALIDSPQKASDFWKVVSPNRQVYCSDPYDITPPYTYKVETDSCHDTGGLVNFVEFMNGRGAHYPSHDVGPAAYLHSGVYIRAFVTDYSRKEGAATSAAFDNNSVWGENIMIPANYDPGISATDKTLLPPQFFPMHHALTWGQLGTAYLEDSYRTAVLEIRMNLKENLMLHSYLDSQSQKRTVVAFSDWRKNHTFETNLGGNVLSRFRIFYPDITSKLIIDNGAGASSTLHYYALYLAGECLNQGNQACNKNLSQLPLAATPVRAGTGNVMKNLMEGDYVLQCLHDAIPDGFPETLISEIPVHIAQGPANKSVAFTCP
jgi:hypothetical protein